MINTDMSGHSKIRLWSPVLLLIGVWLLAGALAGAPERARFFDPGDGTVHDQRTGLRWMKCSLGQRYTGQSCAGSALRLSWHDARSLCKKLGEDAAALQRAGVPDLEWQLPGRADLLTLLDSRIDGGRPHLDLHYFPSSYPFRYWSDEARVDASGTQGIVVNFLEATVYGESVTGEGRESDGKNYVRCVDQLRRVAARISSPSAAR